MKYLKIGIKHKGDKTMNKTYVFKTTTTMKEYNRDKWWIMDDIVKTFETTASTLSEALKSFQKFVEGTAYITISNNALKTKEPMYIDTKEGVKQCGYVITGKTEFQDDRIYKWSTQYVDLWVNISEILDVEF
jgi:uncharacterized protein YccT (UPF0319 family)